MRLDFWGREVTVSVVDKRKKQGGIVSSFIKNSKFRYRFLLLSSMFLVFGILMETSRININFNIGDKADQDIVAYKDVVYYKDLMNEETRKRIIENTTPEYSRNKEVEEDSETKLNAFFDGIDRFKGNMELKDSDLQNFIDENKLNLTIGELKMIVIKDSSSYILSLVRDMQKIYEIGIVKKSDYDKVISSKDFVLTPEEKKLLKNFININLKFDKEKTQEKIDKNIDSLKNQEIKVYRGDIILKKGEVITPDIYEKLEKLSLVKVTDKARKSVGLLLSFFILSMLLYYILKKYSKKIVDSKAFYPSFSYKSFARGVFT